MVHWIRLKSFNACRPDLSGLMPLERRNRALADLTAVRRMRAYSQLFGPACAVPDLRAGRIADARTAPALDEDEVEDVAAVLARVTHVMAPPARATALGQDRETYACGLSFRDLGIGCGAIYTEVPDPRIGFFWRGALRALGPVLLQVVRDGSSYDEVWSRVVAFPAEAD